MYEELLKAVEGCLCQLFGEETVISMDQTAQGLTAPYFVLSVKHAREKRQLGCRFLREQQILLQYVPAEGEEHARQMYGMADQLMEGLDCITLSDGSRLRSTGPVFTVIDGRLQLTAHYPMYFLRKEPDELSMDQVSVQTAAGSTNA